MQIKYESALIFGQPNQVQGCETYEPSLTSEYCSSRTVGVGLGFRSEWGYDSDDAPDQVSLICHLLHWGAYPSRQPCRSAVCLQLLLPASLLCLFSVLLFDAFRQLLYYRNLLLYASRLPSNFVDPLVHTGKRDSVSFAVEGLITEFL